MADKFSTDFQIYTNQADVLKRARPGALFGLFIEAASMHANCLGVGHKDLQEKYNAFWALSKFRMEILTTPSWHQVIKVTTWPSGYNRLFARRYFVITDTDNNILAQGASDWVIMNFESRSLCNVADIVGKITNFNLEEEHIAVNTVKVPLVKREEAIINSRVAMYSHLDMNNHVNSVHYLDWALDCVDDTYLRQHEVKAVDINYQHEIAFGSNVELLRKDIDDNCCIVTGIMGDKVSFSARLKF